jgi:hypothetical protein
MNLPLPPEPRPSEDQLPFRHRLSRAREAEQIRQEFVSSRNRSTLMETEKTGKE